MIWIWLSPLIPAVFGYFFFRMLTWCIFRPYQPTRFFGITIHGIVPAKQTSFAHVIGTAVETKFQSMNLIQSKLNDPALFESLKPTIDEHVDHFLRVKLKQSMPMIGMLIGDRTIKQMKSVFIGELETLFPQIMNQYAGKLIGSLNLQQLVAREVMALSPAEMERAFRLALKPQLNSLYWLGAGFGLLAGIIELLITWLLTN